jgi:hypothetical protein
MKLGEKALNPLIAQLVSTHGAAINPDTMQNVKAVLRVTEQLTATGGGLDKDDMKGLSLIIQCAAGAVEYELEKLEVATPKRRAGDRGRSDQ